MDLGPVWKPDKAWYDAICELAEYLGDSVHSLTEQLGYSNMVSEYLNYRKFERIRSLQAYILSKEMGSIVSLDLEDYQLMLTLCEVHIGCIRGGNFYVYRGRGITLQDNVTNSNIS